MNILVSGSSGFIGGHVVDLLLKRGHKVIGVDYNFGKEFENNGVVGYTADVTNDDVMKEIFKRHKPDAVIHLAAQVSVPASLEDPYFDLGNNAFGTLNLLEMCKKFDVRNFIFTSSAARYGDPKEIPTSEAYPTNPLSPYGCSKVCSENYCLLYQKLYNINPIVLVLSNVYGPRAKGGVIANFIKSVSNNKPLVIYGDGSSTRDFIYVKDVANAIVMAVEKNDEKLQLDMKMMLGKTVWNISTGENLSILRIARMISDNVEFKDKLVGEVKHSALNNKMVFACLGWEPKYSIEKGLAETINGSV